MSYIGGIIIVCTLVTIFTRSLPFICFSKRKLPPIIDHLAKALPSGIMVILVVYCLKDTCFSWEIQNISEIMACLFVFLLQYLYKNMYLSIIGGTACYMILIHILH